MFESEFCVDKCLFLQKIVFLPSANSFHSLGIETENMEFIDLELDLVLVLQMFKDLLQLQRSCCNPFSHSILNSLKYIKQVFIHYIINDNYITAYLDKITSLVSIEIEQRQWCQPFFWSTRVSLTISISIAKK